MRATGLKDGIWDREQRAVMCSGSGGAVLVGTGWDEGYAINSRQGGVFRQLEGIRVSDRDLSDAAVAVAD